MAKPGPVWISLALVTAAITVLVLTARYAPTTVEAAANSCVHNLRQLEGAQQQWALEHDHTNAVPTWAELTPYLRGGRRPVCAQGGTYHLSRGGEQPTCTHNPPPARAPKTP